MAVTAEQRGRLAAHKQDWEELAELDPYFAVVSRAGTKRGGWDVDSFFATGETEIAGLMRRAGKLDRPGTTESALDFGCGLGRLTRPLAGRFKRTVGVDISQRMIEKARVLNADLSGCEFLVNADDDLRMFRDGEFDLVYARAVLQHQPSREVIERYIAELVRILRPGGLLAFTLPSHLPLRFRLQPKRRLYAALRAVRVPATIAYRIGLVPIRVQWAPEEAVVAAVASNGATVLRTVTTPRRRAHTSSYYVTK
jgi:SAM-dependent methyltransferase